MNTFSKLFRLRPLSWVSFSVAILCPIFFYANEVQNEQQYLAQAGPHPTLCGMPLLAAIMLGAIAAILFSMIASALSAVAFFRLPKPRNKRRLIELCILSIPTLLGCSMLALIALG